MAHRNLPYLPLVSNTWHAPVNVANAPDCVCPSQLCVKVGTKVPGGTAAVNKQVILRFIYLPKGQDVRPSWGPLGGDVMECPAGSGRYYGVIDVDDVAKGFPNEFRVACVFPLAPIPGGPANWPIPIP